MNQVKVETTGTSAPLVRSGRRLHPLPVRVMHWINAVVMLIMITSGWGIYDDDVIVRGFHVSQFWRLGDWAAWSCGGLGRLDRFREEQAKAGCRLKVSPFPESNSILDVAVAL